MKKIIVLFILMIFVLLTGCTANNVPAPGSSPDNSISQKALYPVNINGKFGFLDSSGKLVVQPKYDVGADFNDGLGLVFLNGKWGFIDSTGKEAIPLQYKNQPADFKNGLSRTLDNDGKAIFFNTQGKVIWKAP